jgi:hypothetical protein
MAVTCREPWSAAADLSAWPDAPELDADGSDEGDAADDELPPALDDAELAPVSDFDVS